MITGWLFDIYCLDDKIVFWIKNEFRLYKIEKQWTPSLYVASNSPSKLKRLKNHPLLNPFVKSYKKASKIQHVFDTDESSVLQLTLKNSKDILKLAKSVEKLDTFGVYKLYNVDVPPEQTYLYENDLYPLGKYQIKKDDKIKWNELSDIADTNYVLPILRKTILKVYPKTNKSIPNFSDAIEKIQIDDTIIKSESEQEMILTCVEYVRNLDPDILITHNGDSWDFPYLAERAFRNKILDKLVFGREDNRPILRSKQKGISYFAYGQVHFKPTATKLLGRIHIDLSNCFIWENENSLHGLYEISRTCRLPLQTAARASIGKCMSSIQFYNAVQRGLLVPWKPVVSEIFKTRNSLFVGDRGGLILEPRVGIYENVGEIDFESLFGNIMLKKNISSETINCKCCQDSDSLVPELRYHICNRRTGIVPQSLKLLLNKRHQYSKLLKTTTNKSKLEIHKQRKAALKWILVTSFGYLGFNNAKFGRIDAHMSVCAFARKLLLDAIHVAEEEGFVVLHGIVDSIWVQKKGATKKDYASLGMKISEKIGFDLSLDIYNWIVFLPSKENNIVPVANRYFGAKSDGKIKIRGIEARRHDTPKFFKKCQLEILNIFSSCKTISNVKASIVEAKLVQKKYQDMLFSQKIPPTELTFVNRITKGTNEHKTNTIQADAINQLKWAGKRVEPGQKIQYIISNHSRKLSKRVIPKEIMDRDECYDVKYYSKLLDECCKTVIGPFE